MAFDRRGALVQALNSSGYVEVRTLSRLLGVSLATVRRDLAQLEAEGVAIRTHGGAMFASTSTSLELPLSAKQAQMVQAKREIARAAVDLIRPGETVLLDAGSTTWEIAAAMVGHKKATVVSNDLQVLLKLASDPDIAVVDTGGILRQPVYTLYGPPAETFLSGLHVDWTFLGADAIHPEAGVTNVNLVEVPVKRAMVAAGRRTVVVADHTKFGKTAFASVCGLSDVEAVLTDSAVPDSVVTEYDRLGYHVIRASDPGSLATLFDRRPESFRRDGQ